MGQYHVLVNVDKREFVSPHGIGLGLKQWEHLYGSGGTLSDVLYVLTMTSPDRGGGDLPASEISGRWVGDRVMVWGDYTDPEDLPKKLRDRFDEINEHDAEIGGLWTDVTDIVASQLEVLFGIRVKEGSGWKEREYTEDSEFNPKRFE